MRTSISARNPLTSVSIAAIVLIAAIVSFPALAAEGIVEILLGIQVTTNDILLSVASGGCTKKEDFSIEVDRGLGAKPNYILTVRRIKSDNCKAYLPEGTIIKFGTDEVGLSGAFEVTLANKIGNTSQHRLVAYEKPATTPVETPDSLLPDRGTVKHDLVGLRKDLEHR